MLLGNANQIRVGVCAHHYSLSIPHDDYNYESYGSPLVQSVYKCKNFPKEIFPKEIARIRFLYIETY